MLPRLHLSVWRAFGDEQPKPRAHDDLPPFVDAADVLELKGEAFLLSSPIDQMLSRDAAA